jgi:sporulation protein YlmC with PRC-barrel domain
MDVGLGMHLLTRDDKDVGTVDRLILDPDTGVVTSIVIRKGTFLPRDVEVPMGALEVESNGEVRLSYIADQIDKLPPFVADKYEPPPAGYVSPLGYPIQALYWPIADGRRTQGSATGEEPPTRRRQDAEHAVIREGSAVLSRDGKEVGIVHRLSYDPNDGVLRHFVVREGMLFTKDVAFPASLIARVNDGMVQLSVDADDLPNHELA